MIYNFKVNEIPKLNQVGGKAKALIETTKAGFPVPEGLALSVEFFSEWLTTIKSSEQWEAVLKDTSKENSDLVKAKASQLTFTPKMKQAFEVEMKELKGQVFAVRSSSPEEDLEGTSFAGMYETLLGQKRDMLERAVAEAFSSCFDYRVMAYKKENGLNLDGTSIAVVVQRQITSDVSGVGFSLNPLNNCFDEVVINASFGLGEAIVSGIVTPDTYVVDSIKHTIIEKKVNEKQIALWLKDNGGIEEKVNKEPSKQALSDEQIIELSNLIKKCENHYGLPMDTEWAFEKGALYLLQSRPITTYNPFFPELITKPGEDKKIYIDLMGMTQGFTESMSVLGTELWGMALEAIKGEVMICSIDGTSPTLHGRQYINISHIKRALGESLAKRLLNGYDGNIKRIFENIDMDEYEVKEVPASLKGAKMGLPKMVIKMLPSGFKAMFGDYKKVMEEYNVMADDLMKQADGVSSEQDFEESASKIISQFDMLMNAGGAIVGVLAFQNIKKKFKGLDVEEELIALSMDLKGNPTSAMGKLQFKLASYDEFQQTKSKEIFLDKLAKKEYSKAFQDDFDEFIKKYGVRCFMEIDVASKRAYEDLGSVYDQLKEINIHDSQITKTKEKRKEAYDKLYAIAKEKGFAKKFESIATKYQDTFGYREHPKYVIAYMLGRLHDVALTIGETFVKQGRLEDNYQIFDLSSKEISQAQKNSSLDLQALREKNLAPYKKVSHVKDWPLVIDSRGKIFKAKLEIKDGDIAGDPIAPGKVRGRAKVLTSPYEKPLNPGEILVTKCTEPSWTPIFINAAGVVMEVGGPLQHGGIIAREYGIPCVSGLMGIMDIIKDGDLIEVDGSNGIVRVIKR